MRHPVVFLVMLALTLYFGYQFYSTLNWLYFGLVWIPLPAYAAMASDKVIKPLPNIAKVHEDMCDSEMGASLPIRHLYEMGSFHGRPMRMSAEPITQKRTGKVFYLFKHRAGMWSNGYLAPTAYDSVNEAFYANMSSDLEPRSDGEIRRWGKSVINPEDSQSSGLWSGLLRLVKKRAKVSDFDINEMARRTQ